MHRVNIVLKLRPVTHLPHELILSIRRDEADAALRVKLTETHTLVERTVVDGYRLLSTGTTGAEGEES